MSDNDFIIIDEEKETPVTTEGKESSDTEKKEVFQTSAKEEHEDEYEKIDLLYLPSSGERDRKDDRSAEPYYGVSGLYAEKF